MFRLSVEFLLSDKLFIFKEKTIIFFFFLKKEGDQKVYKENSIILYFSIKKKKIKKYIYYCFSVGYKMSCTTFFFFLSDKKNVNGFIVENQRFAFWAFSEVLRQPKPME